MKKILTFCFSFGFLTIGHSNIARQYVDRYIEIAISEMKRTGIPASIKLAQALLESDMGRSALAKDANNHFGIKCGRAWNGKEYYRKDDDRDKNGNLIKSCFRVFNNAEESFVAHSNFITDKRKQYRYGFLFNYQPTDYHSWAHGLKKSGYATDPKYAEKLIQIIEKWNLHQYDAKINYTKINTINFVNEHEENNSIKNSLGDKNVLNYKIDVINQVPVVSAKGGESLEELSFRVGISVHDLLRYNDLFLYDDNPLKKGEIVFLKQKKRKYSKGIAYHKLRKGDTMRSVSQQYGIRLNTLYVINRLPENAEVLVGQLISLTETIDKQHIPKHTFFTKQVNKPQFLFENDDSVR